MTIPGAAAAQEVAVFRSQLEAYFDQFRQTGARPAGPALALESQLRAALSEAPTGNRSALLNELATVQRIQGRFEDAIETYHAAIDDASGDGDVLFNAWMGIARAHAYGTNNPGAADSAFQHAVEAAGANPSRKRRYEMADYASQLQERRGELEAALANASEANRLAESDDERFYAQLDAGSVLREFAKSCDYRQLVDAKTFLDSNDDGWGACRRAVAAARSYYARSRDTAERLGWDYLRGQSEEFIVGLGTRLSHIEGRASMDAALVDSSAFNAEDAEHVLVNEAFDSGLPDSPALAEMIARVVANAGSEDAQTAFLLGLKAEAEGNGDSALAYFERAVQLLESARASLFDMRQRGTIVERGPEFVRGLALKLLARGNYDRAFAIFESIRASGLGQLAAAYEVQEFSDAERRWLARLVDLESRESAILTRVVESTIAGEEDSDADRRLDRLDATRAELHELRGDPKFADTIGKLRGEQRGTEGLAELNALVKATGIPVMLFWVTPSNVVVWVVSPHGMEIKTVFLPEEVVAEKVRRVADSVITRDRPFDATAARQLHAYLIQPFERHLVSDEMIIVPQGPLVTLPFEALMDARTGQYLVEKVAVSYAPSAAFAISAMRRARLALSSVTAVYDEEIENGTSEIKRLGHSLANGLDAIASQTLSSDEVIKTLGGKKMVHVLLHGEFNPFDPLQSKVDLNNRNLSAEDRAVTAAELLATDWRDARMVVFSSCESARMNVRISNEVYGLSWAPLVGGADAVVMSRWRVQESSSADWMADFYGRLAAGSGSPAIAAAETMRRMIGGGQAHPFYWAAPQVFGR